MLEYFALGISFITLILFICFVCRYEAMHFKELEYIHEAIEDMHNCLNRIVTIITQSKYGR